jgi:hypothetical protein
VVIVVTAVFRLSGPFRFAIEKGVEEKDTILFVPSSLTTGTDDIGGDRDRFDGGVSFVEEGHGGGGVGWVKKVRFKKKIHLQVI